MTLVLSGNIRDFFWRATQNKAYLDIFGQYSPRSIVSLTYQLRMNISDHSARMQKLIWRYSVQYVRLPRVTPQFWPI